MTYTVLNIRVYEYYCTYTAPFTVICIGRHSLITFLVFGSQDVFRGFRQTFHTAGHRARQPGRLDDRTGFAFEAAMAGRAGQETVEERI